MPAAAAASSGRRSRMPVKHQTSAAHAYPVSRPLTRLMPIVPAARPAATTSHRRAPAAPATPASRHTPRKYAITPTTIAQRSAASPAVAIRCAATTTARNAGLVMPVSAGTP
jgi:hypothetical protein